MSGAFDVRALSHEKYPNKRQAYDTYLIMPCSGTLNSPIQENLLVGWACNNLPIVIILLWLPAFFELILIRRSQTIIFICLPIIFLTCTKTWKAHPYLWRSDLSNPSHSTAHCQIRWNEPDSGYVHRTKGPSDLYRTQCAESKSHYTSFLSTTA